MKVCSKCKTKKPVEEFNRSSANPDGRHGWCKICTRAADRDRRLLRLDEDREAALIRKYGITQAQYDEIFEQQGGVCAICERPESRVVKGNLNRMAVDHDHETDEVRGLLCAKCNTALGKFNDDPALLERAIDYLKRPRKAVNLTATSQEAAA